VQANICIDIRSKADPESGKCGKGHNVCLQIDTKPKRYAISRLPALGKAPFEPYKMNLQDDPVVDKGERKICTLRKMYDQRKLDGRLTCGE
jgi:hypothetical protein